MASLRLPVLAVPLAVLLAGGPACRPLPSSSRVIAEGAPRFRLAGDVSLGRDNGTIVLRLHAGSCLRQEQVLFDSGHVESMQRACAPFATMGWQSARLTAPWGQTFTPTQGGPNGLVFTVDWTATGIDPLASDDPDVLQQPWRLGAPDAGEDLLWTPPADDRAAMLTLIGEATDTQALVYEVSAPPSIEVSEFRFEGDLRNGTDNELVVKVTNHGAGNAYRLGAITRSNVPALHGLHLSYGRLRPGESKTRRVKVSLPRMNDESDALVVLVFSEAHRYGPVQSSKRYPLRPAVDIAKLALTCRFADLAGAKPRVDAGMTVHVNCNVRNEGALARSVRLRAKITGSSKVVDSEPFDLGGDRSAAVTLAVDVPRDASLDSELAVQLSAREDAGGAAADTTLVLEVARPQICPDGKLTREQFGKKRIELRRALDAGLISREEYDRYEAELVGCLE